MCQLVFSHLCLGCLNVQSSSTFLASTLIPFMNNCECKFEIQILVVPTFCATLCACVCVCVCECACVFVCVGGGGAGCFGYLPDGLKSANQLA